MCAGMVILHEARRIARCSYVPWGEFPTSNTDRGHQEFTGEDISITTVFGAVTSLWTRDKGRRDCQRNWLSNSNGDNWVLNTRPRRSLFPGAQVRSEWQPREPNPQRTMKMVCRMLLYFPTGKYMNCQHNQKKTRIHEQESGLLPTQNHILLPSFWI